MTEDTRQVDADVLIAGRGGDCHIQLSDLAVRLAHVRISQVRTGRILVEGLGGGRFILSGRPQIRAEIDLGSGASLQIGQHVLTLAADESGLTVEVEEKKRQSRRNVGQKGDPFSLRGTWLSKRFASWVLATVVVLLGLAAPIVVYSEEAGNEKHSAAGVGAADSRMSAFLEPVQSRGHGGIEGAAGVLWSSGTLSSAHRSLTDDCTLCHALPFVSVRDETCLSCHGEIRHHGDPNKLQAFSPKLSAGAASLLSISSFLGRDAERCSACHSEHNPSVSLSSTAQESCASCHGEVKIDGLEAAADFGRQHPEFRPTLSAGAGADGAPTVTRIATIADLQRSRAERERLLAAQGGGGECDGFEPGKANFRGSDGAPLGASGSGDRSGLVFPHKVHLAVDGCVSALISRLGSEAPYGAALTCADCHTADEAGQLFEPVRMEDDCAVCHSLVFETSRGVNRVLRHGEPLEVIAAMNDFYRAQTIEGVLRSEADARVRPGPAGLRPGALRETAFAFASTRAQERVEAIFSSGGACFGCHEITRPEGGRIEDVKVAPVTLQERFLPKSSFPHSKHSTSACSTCHEAETSNTSSDVLLPSVKTCQTCHGGEHAADKTPSTCLTCHGFHSHSETVPLMRTRAAPGMFFSARPERVWADLR
ncbi:MAG: cytochrome c3 family protein [Alphaproteobacteria bacterium]|nr:cytochrome c3 family protein [Alphaproteobacteria bacterium]